MLALSIKCVTVVAAVILGAGASAAGEFGALAVSPDGAWGYSYGYDDPDGAKRRAQAECDRHARGCSVVTLFETVCVTVVRNERGQAHVTWAGGQTQAVRAGQALDACRRRGGLDCRVLVEFCTGSAQDQ